MATQLSTSVQSAEHSSPSPSSDPSWPNGLAGKQGRWRDAIPIRPAHVQDGFDRMRRALSSSRSTPPSVSVSFDEADVEAIDAPVDMPEDVGDDGWGFDIEPAPARGGDHGHGDFAAGLMDEHHQPAASEPVAIVQPVVGVSPVPSPQKHSILDDSPGAERILTTPLLAAPTSLPRPSPKGSKARKAARKSSPSPSLL